jgi:predicted nuclease of predicted toxin-antitoxin system
VKFLVDMNLAPRWSEFLNSSGFDATHWSQVGAHDTADAVIMAFAASHDYVVLTHDLDFGAILAVTHGTKPSVIQIRADDVSPTAIGATVIRTIRQLSTELEDGVLVTIYPSRSRVRVLPLLGKI